MSCSPIPVRIVQCSRVGLALALGLGSFACMPASTIVDAFFNNTTSLGGDTPGERGTVSVAFNNNTSYRAIFTFGTYDPLNTPQDTPLAFPIEFGQFFVDADPANRLEAHTSSDAVGFSCGRAVSVGGGHLIQLIFENGLDEGADRAALLPLPDPDTGQAQARAGIAFSDRHLDQEGADLPTAGWAEGLVTLQGAEYRCGSLLVYTFEEDGVWPDGKAKIRVDLAVILP